MWHWLLEKVPKRFQLWFKLVVFSAGFHCLILFLLLFLYRGSTSIYSFDLNKIAIDTDATIVFMPLHKTIKSPNTQIKQTGTKTASMPATEQAPPEIKKNTRAEKAPTMIVSENVRKKKLPKKRKKETQKIAKKMSVKSVAEQPAAEQLPTPVQKPAQENPGTDNQAPENSNIVYVGRQDLEMLQLQQAIVHEISEQWRPPRGIAKDKVCEIKMLVDWQGVISNVVIEKSSGIVMYDVSARAAASAIKVPQAAWGKELSITFKQT